MSCQRGPCMARGFSACEDAAELKLVVGSSCLKITKIDCFISDEGIIFRAEMRGANKQGQLMEIM